MKEYDYYAVADRVKLIDERTALEHLKRLSPDFSQYREFSEFCSDYVKMAKRSNASLYIPLSIILGYEKEYGEHALSYALVKLLKNLSDNEEEVFLGIDYTDIDRIDKCLISAAEYLSKAHNFQYFDGDYIMHIRYRKDFQHKKDVFIVNDCGHLHAKILTLIDDINTFRYELQIDDITIPEQLAETVLSCIHTKYREYALTQFTSEDDRCYLDDTFCIYVNSEYMNLPKTKDGWCNYNPVEYFGRVNKSSFHEFNQLLAYLYDVFSADDRKMFPFKK